MIGMVLAAGAGRRLRPYTDTLPKALVPVDGETTILDIALRNLAAVDLRDVVVVVGYAADAVEERQAATSKQRHGVTAHAGAQRQGRDLEQRLLDVARPRPHARRRADRQRRHRAPGRRSRRRCSPRAARSILLALDTEKALADEEMKVQVERRRRRSPGSPS